MRAELRDPPERHTLGWGHEDAMSTDRELQIAQAQRLREEVWRARRLAFQMSNADVREELEQYAIDLEQQAIALEETS